MGGAALMGSWLVLPQMTTGMGLRALLQLVYSMVGSCSGYGAFRAEHDKC